jgi:hypothetical protein
MERSRALIERDIAYGYVSREQAAALYGYLPVTEAAK